jgi:hypothetical protein
MLRLIQSRVARMVAPLVGLSAAAVILACSDAAGVNELNDDTPPSLNLSVADPVNDTSLNFNVTAHDNLGIKAVHVSLTGAVGMEWDTVLTSAVTSLNVSREISVSKGVPFGSAIMIVAYATDGANNKSTVDTLHMTVGNLPPADARITSPNPGTAVVIGKSVILSLSGKSSLKVRSLGFRTSGPFVAADSALYNSPMSDSVALLDTLAIPSDAGSGTLLVTPFVIDSLGQRTLGSTVSLNVQTAASANSKPTVTFGTTPRIEVNDTIHVEATDPTGIVAIGYEVRQQLADAPDARDSLISDGSITSALKTFSMQLPYTTFPTKVYIKAFATNSNGTRAYAQLSSGVDRVDTITVVAGVTKPLPQGGEVADALYHPRADRLYLTNIERNRLEVFSLQDSSFKTSIQVGSRPWGLTAWPRDRNGTMGDTLLVANSGGTYVSYVNIASPSALYPSGREVYSYALPNIVLYTVKSVVSETGQPIQQRTVYDMSDRPQFVAATCAGSTLTGSPCGDVMLAYSTAPTGGQSLPFANRGSIRWENLSKRMSHYWFEQALGQSAGKADTLEVVRFAANGVGSDSVLVPYNQLVQNSLGDTTRYSVTVVIDRLAFRDTTYVRNSGNFRRAIAGEGGPVLGSRAMMYDATLGMQTTVSDINGTAWTLTTPIMDLGISRPHDVSDFIANTYSTVRGVGINFDGMLSAIRGDSTYLIDPTLRLQGLLQTSAAAGFDFHPSSAGNGVSGTSCYAFAASSEPQIDIFETRHYQRISTVPIRDPIIGPIKAALRTSTGNIVLVGATARGVVIITLSNSYSSACN